MNYQVVVGDHIPDYVITGLIADIKMNDHNYVLDAFSAWSDCRAKFMHEKFRMDSESSMPQGGTIVVSFITDVYDELHFMSNGLIVVSEMYQQGYWRDVYFRLRMDS